MIHPVLRLADLTTFPPIAAELALGTPFSMAESSFYTYRWTEADLRADDVFFLAAVWP